MWLPYSCHILNTILYHTFRLQPVVNQKNAENNKASTNLFKEDYDTQMKSVTKLLNTTKKLVMYLKKVVWHYQCKVLLFKNVLLDGTLS